MNRFYQLTLFENGMRVIVVASSGKEARQLVYDYFEKYPVLLPLAFPSKWLNPINSKIKILKPTKKGVIIND